METIDLDCWESFEMTVSSIFADWQKPKTEKSIYVSPPRFRGHANASWKLQTTLERFSSRTFKAEDYYQTIKTVRPAVVSLTGQPWNIPEKFAQKRYPSGYEFMIYLRHHGFPSPLVDWTSSPFVAAFFAFRSREKQRDDKVAIYSYIEWQGDAKSHRLKEPNIYGLGRYVESHKRHYAQQCEYTICRKKVGKSYVYSSHEAAFSGKPTGRGMLTKYTLPVSEREKALKQLQRMNITAFSLFGSEESLMEMLAYQEIEDTCNQD